MPTPSNSFLVMEDSNQELPVNLMKSVAIEVPTGNHNRPGVDPRELLAEIRRLSRRVEALEEQLASEPPDEEDVLELLGSGEPYRHVSFWDLFLNGKVMKYKFMLSLLW